MSHEVRDEAIKRVIGIEGGYVDDPADSGGKTNYGVTERTARRWGYMGPMTAFRTVDAYHLYIDMFWDEMGCDRLTAMGLTKTAGELFEIGVNTGTGRAVRFLQKALNGLNNGQTYYDDITVDGVWGGKTEEAVRGLMRRRKVEKADEVLETVLNCQQGDFYLDLVARREKDERFLWGWLNERVVQRRD